MGEQPSNIETSEEAGRQRARDALTRQDELRTPPARPARRKAEDTSAGCHELAANDRARAVENCNDRMKAVFERSADAWDSRGKMFKRLEAQRETQDNG